jgi:hypothetical protein
MATATFKDPNHKDTPLLIGLIGLLMLITSSVHASPLSTAEYTAMDTPTIKVEKVGCFVTPTPQMAARGERFYKEGC